MTRRPTFAMWAPLDERAAEMLVSGMGAGWRVETVGGRTTVHGPAGEEITQWSPARGIAWQVREMRG